MVSRAYMINGRYTDADYFAATVSDLFAAGWKLVPPAVPVMLEQRDEVLEARIPDGGWGNVTDESRGDAPKG